MDLDKLKEPFKATDIEWRVQRAGFKNGKPWAFVLAYVTNRAIMDRLDDVCGPGKWKNYFENAPSGGVLCGISIKCGEEWVTKWDGADNTDIEAVKGGLSSSMKRAGSQWGIGRYLYNLEANFAIISTGGKHSAKAKDESKDKWFKWDAPKLPAWALPTPGKPQGEPQPDEPEKSAIEKCIEKMQSFTDVDSFQSYLDESWAKIEHAFKDDKQSMKQATGFMVKHLSELTKEVL